jgi:tetratricopeptide (TPR) repeat protein
MTGMNKRLFTHHAVPICLVLIITTLAVFWQLKDHEFINFDDPLYVTENLHIQGGITLKGVTWAFTTFHAGNWHPLTWLSHMLDVQFFGLKAGWHHLMNLLFHIASTLLLFLVLHRMTKALWQSAFVAALFALHPLHVESVAWVSERKDVLSTFFWMLTMGAYVFYVEKPEVKRYVLTLFFFALGLMAKPMLVTLPFVLLLLDYWPLKRLRYGTADPKNPAEALPPSAPVQQKRKSKKQHTVKEKVQAKKPTDSPYQWTLIRPLVWEKIPFFILTVLSSAVTYVAQWKGGAMKPLEAIAFDGRIANALVSYVAYIAKMIWPANLAFLYPHPGMVPHWQILGAVLFLALSTFLILRMVRRVPYLTVGWLWYLGTLVPVIGIVQVGLQGMADRYTYVPSIGLFIMIAWGVPELFNRWRYKKNALAVLSVLILSMLTIGTWKQVHYWQNSLTLFGRTLEVTSNNYIIHNELGNTLKAQGKLDEAISQYNKALRINPNYAYAHNNLGTALQEQGRLTEAISHYAEALRNNKNFADAYNNMGTVLQEQGSFQEAARHYIEAIRLRPDYEKPYINLGETFAAQGKYGEAMEYYTKALRINPYLIKLHYNMGTILLSQGKAEEAIIHFREAVRIKPDYLKAHNNLGSALLLIGKKEEAIAQFREALRYEPDHRVVQENLKRAMAPTRKSE